MNTNDRDFRGYNLTPEDADRITQGDRKALTAFFELNQSRLRGMAKNYALRHNAVHGGDFYNPEEMLTQLYLDLPYLKFTNAYTLTLDIKHKSFAWSAYGGYSYRVSAGLPHSRSPWEYIDNPLSLDAPIDDAEDDCEAFEDIVATDEDNPLEVMLRAEERPSLEASEIVEKIRILLSPREREYLGYYLSGYSPTEIATLMKLKDSSNIQRQTHYRLVTHYKEILALIFPHGDLPDHLVGIAPDDYEKANRFYERRVEARMAAGSKPRRTFETEAERHEAENASKRAWYERNRELQNERRRQRRAAARAAKKSQGDVLTPA